MRKIIIYIPLIVLSFLFFIEKTSASDQTATSCSAFNIQKAIDDCVNSGGGIVYIPVGECTWSATDKVTKNTAVVFGILGAGQNSTIIDVDDNATKTSSLFEFMGGGIREFGQMKITGNNYDGTGYPLVNRVYSGITFEDNRNAPGNEIRVHHLTMGGFSNSLGAFHGYYGVVDHGIFENAAGTSCYGWYVNGDGTYPQSVSFGTRKALFFEDCSFEQYYHAVAGFCGASIVLRRTTHINQTHTIDVHEPGYNFCRIGYGTYGKAGGRSIEIYDNSFTNTGGGDCIDPRGGSGIITNNEITNFKNGIQLTLDGNSRGGKCSVTDNCPYTWDYSDDSCGAEDGCCQSPINFWIWDNNFTNVQYSFSNEGGHECLRENTDYYLRSPNLQQDDFAWTPYIYPHPLRNENPSDIIPPANPSGLLVR